MSRYRKATIVAVNVVLISLGLSAASASSANISHSYHSTSYISEGSIVSLVPGRSGYVEPANINNGKHLIGVAVNSNDSLLAVDPTKGDVQVATNGSVNVLVSNLDGNINTGDPVAASPFNGIGIKAFVGSYDIGLAQTSFNGNSSGSVTQEVTDKNGQKTYIKLGLIRLTIAVGIDSSVGSQQPLNLLQRLAKSLTGRTIPTLRIVISIIIAITATISLVTLIYASIYGSIISVGRNPLAKFAVFRTLWAVLFMILVLSSLASGTIYFLLR